MDPTQIELMEQMRRLLAENAANTRDMTRALGEQLQILRDIKEAGGVASGSMRGAGESLNEFTNAAEGAAEAAQQTFDTMTSGLKVTDMFSNSWELLKTNFSTMLTAITTPINAVFGFLGTAFNALMKQAADLQQAMYDLLNAFEKVRAEFGSFAENTSGRVKRAFGDFNKQLRETGDGVNYFGSKFAPGIDGSIARLQLMEQYAGDLGAVFDTLGEDFNFHGATKTIHQTANIVGASECEQSFFAMIVSFRGERAELAFSHGLVWDTIQHRAAADRADVHREIARVIRERGDARQKLSKLHRCVCAVRMFTARVRAAS